MIFLHNVIRPVYLTYKKYYSKIIEKLIIYKICCTVFWHIFFKLHFLLKN